MANAGGVTLDTVSFSIEANADKASSSINRLSSSLASLRDATKGGFNGLNKLSNILNGLAASTTSLDGIGKNLESVQGVVDGLNELQKVESPKGLNKNIKAIQNLKEVTKDLGSSLNNLSYVSEVVPSLTSLSDIKTPTGLNGTVKSLTSLASLGTNGIGNLVSQLQRLPEAVEPLQSLKSIQNPVGFNNTAKSVASITDTFSKLDQPGVLENLTRVSNELTNALTPLAGKMSQIGNGFTSLQQLADKYGVSVTKVREKTKSSVSVFKRLSDAAKTVGNSFTAIGKNSIQSNLKKIGTDVGNLYSKFKQLTLSLLGTRTMFTMTRKAISEYMDMDTKLQDKLDNLWRALGAQLAPAVEAVMYVFEQFVRVIYSIVKVLTGVDLISRANSRSMAAYAGSTKKAVKELGNLAKFDDLNTVEFDKDKSSGNGSSGPKLIDLKEIDLTPIQKIVDWMIKLKKAILEALDTGKWYNVGKVLGEGINEAVSFLLKKIPEIRKKLFEVAKNFGDVLNGVIETVHWEDIGKLITESLILLPDTITELLKEIHWESVGNAINDLIKGFDPVKIINSFGTMFTELASGISTALLQIDFKGLAIKLSDTIIAFFSNISQFIDAIPWGDLGLKIHDLFTTIKWKDIATSFVKAIKSALAGLGSFVAGALFGKTFKSKSKAALAGVGVILGGVLGKAIGNLLLSTLSPIVSKLGNLILGKITSPLNKVKTLLGGASSTASTATSIDFKLPSFGTIVKGLGELALIIAAVTAFVYAYGALAKIPEFKQAISGGLDELKTLFFGLGEIIIPIAALSAGVVALGVSGIATVASGMAGLALILTITPGIVIAANAIFGSSEAKQLISGGIDMLKLLFNGLSEIVIPVAAFAAIIVGLGFATPATVGAGLLGFVGIIGTLGLVVARLGELTKVDGFTEVVGEGGKVLMTLGEILGGFAGSIVKGFLDVSFKGFGELADNLVDFAKRISPFFDKAKNIDKDSTEAVKNMANAILILTAADLLEGISKFLNFGQKTSLSDFGAELETFGPYFASYADSIKDVDGKSVKASASAAESLTKFAKSIPNNGGMLAGLVGDNLLSIFGLELSLFGPNFAKYAKSVKNIDEKAVKASASAATSLTKFAKEVPNQGGYLSVLVGAKSLTLFGLELASFGGNFAKYAKSVAGVKDDVVKKSANAALSLTKFAKEVPNQGGYLSNLFGNNNLTKFGKALKDFGGYYASYYKTIKTVKTDTINTVTDSLGKLVIQFNTIQRNGLSATVKSFGNALKDSAGNIKSFFTTALPKDRGWSIGNTFGSGIASGIIYAIKHATYPSIKLSSNTQETVAKFKMSALATGTNKIPQDGPYYLHAGESVVPKKYNPAMGGGTNEETNKKLDALISIMENLSYTNIVNVGNETLYKKQQQFNKQQQNKYGTINL